MLPLAELQQKFLDDICKGSKESLNLIEADGMEASARLQVYRNNMLFILTDLLSAIYPVLKKLVGDDFFNATARAFIAKNTPHSGNMHLYGAHMAVFLADFPPAQQLPYLPDVARLEWAWHKAFYALDVKPLDTSVLVSVIEGGEEPSFNLHPSCTLLASPYPVQDIWQVNKYDEDKTINLNAGGVHILIYRKAGQVPLWQLSESEYAFLTAIHKGGAFSEAFDYLADLPGTEINAFLSRLIAEGILSEHPQKGNTV